MSILSKDTIKRLCETKPPLIEEYNNDNFQPSSYDISIGDQYYLFDKNKKKVKEMIHLIDENESLYIPPNELCYIISKEKLNMPNDIVAHVSLKTYLIKNGIMLAAQPPVDPGYRGKIYAMLYNLSNKEVCFNKKDTILTLEFMKLDKPIEELDPTQPKHHMDNFDDLKMLIKKPIESSLAETRRQYKKMIERSQRIIPVLIAVLTFILAVLTVFITIITAGQILSCGGGKKNQGQLKDKANVQYFIEDQKIAEVKKK